MGTEVLKYWINGTFLGDSFISCLVILLRRSLQSDWKMRGSCLIVRGGEVRGELSGGGCVPGWILAGTAL